MTTDKIDQLCVNTIRALSMDAVQKANSGHPGTPMGMAGQGYVLWTKHLRHNPANPNWHDRDRFVLSMGHASMLLYSLLHLTGYGLTLDDLREFRQWDSKTPGHPERGHAPGVETTTGPLGQGFANGVGMAIAERFLASQFNRPGHTIVDHWTYGFCSDGDLMEGISYEAASLAGHLKLGKLIYLYDANGISIDGSTALAFSEDVAGRFRSMGWHVQEINGMDLTQIGSAVEAAKVEAGRPSLIIAPTRIGFPSPNKTDKSSAHGAPLGESEIRLTKEVMGWPVDGSFHVPGEARTHMLRTRDRGVQLESEWQSRFDAYRQAFPTEAARFEEQMGGRLPAGWDSDIPVFEAKSGAMATRNAGKSVLNALAKKIPNLIGGSADLAESTLTVVEDSGSFNSDNPSGRNLHFGIREHAMGSLGNGLAAHGGVIPFGSTFLVFSDYQRPAIRLAALAGLHNIFVFTHDSIGLGEDGPTHQPIEHLASLRAIPNLVVIRPADANETAWAWNVAVDQSGPCVIVLTRQRLPILDQTRYASAAGLKHGAYVLIDADNNDPEVVLIATGSEVYLALEARDVLTTDGIGTRVVSMPSWELFSRQSEAYRDSVLPPSLAGRIAIEAGSPMGWERWVGLKGEIIGLNRFGASAPGPVVLEKLGFTAERIVNRVRANRAALHAMVDGRAD